MKRPAQPIAEKASWLPTLQYSLETMSNSAHFHPNAFYTLHSGDEFYVVQK